MWREKIFHPTWKFFICELAVNENEKMCSAREKCCMALLRHLSRVWRVKSIDFGELRPLEHIPSRTQHSRRDFSAQITKCPASFVFVRHCFLVFFFFFTLKHIMRLCCSGEERARFFLYFLSNNFCLFWFDFSSQNSNCDLAIALSRRSHHASAALLTQSGTGRRKPHGYEYTAKSRTEGKERRMKHFSLSFVYTQPRGFFLLWRSENGGSRRRARLENQKRRSSAKADRSHAKELNFAATVRCVCVFFGREIEACSMFSLYY